MSWIHDNKGARTGLFFGATSGVITTIGLIAGLNAGTESVVAVLGGILVVAVADAMSDALGIHLAQEADPESTEKHIWSATLWTFSSKLLVALSFARHVAISQRIPERRSATEAILDHAEALLGVGRPA